MKAKHIFILALVLVFSFAYIMKKHEHRKLMDAVLVCLDSETTPELETINGVDMSFKIPANMKKIKSGVNRVEAYESSDMFIMFIHEERATTALKDDSTFIHEFDNNINEVRESFKTFLQNHSIISNINIIENKSAGKTKLILLEAINTKSYAKMLVYETIYGDNWLVILSFNNPEAQKKVASIEKSIILEKGLNYPVGKINKQ